MFLDNYVMLPQIGPTQTQQLHITHDLSVCKPRQTVVVQTASNRSEPSNTQYENSNVKHQQQSRDLQYKSGHSGKSIKQEIMETEMGDACVLNNQGTYMSFQIY